MGAIVRSRLADDSFVFEKDGYPVPSRDPQGFDAAIGRISYRGDLAGLYSKFSIGGTSGDAALPGLGIGFTSDFYCLGPVGQVQRRWGHYFAAISWKGIIGTRNLAKSTQDNLITLGSGHQLQSLSRNVSTDEILFPQERDGMTLYAPPPFGQGKGYEVQGYIANGAFVPTGDVPQRVRIIVRKYTVSVRGIYIGDRKTATIPPKLLLGNPLTEDPAQDLPNDPLNPLYTWSSDNGAASGWVCRNYQANAGGEYPLGDKILSFWTAEYEYVLRKGM